MDKSIFDMSGVELVKKKYYNAAKVTEVLAEIRAQAGEFVEADAVLATLEP